MENEALSTILGKNKGMLGVIVFVVSVTAMAFWQVIIPINNIQIQIATLTTQIVGFTKSMNQLTSDGNTAKLEIATMQLQITNLQNIKR